MHALDLRYSLRMALPADAETIARHRALMFRDMGSLSQAESDLLLTASLPWLQNLLATGEYIGWLVLFGEQVVAGGGICLREMGPVPGCCRVGRWGYIMNVYTVETHRRHGVARLILKTILEWTAANRLDHVTLAASDEGRPLYESLGFVPTNDMKLPILYQPPHPKP
jgi:GNAT superfamily N-acetyltransferase